MVQVKRKIWRALLALPGATTILWVLFSPYFRQPDGWFSPVARVPAIGGIALMLLGATWRSRWKRCAGWLSLALIGHACALELIFSPPYSVYQHYLSWEEMLKSVKSVFLFGLIVQSIITLWRARTIWPALWAWLFRLLKGWQIAIFLMFMGFVGVVLSEKVFQSGTELVMVGLIAVINTLNLILAVRAIPSNTLQVIVDWLRQWFESDVEGRWTRRLPWLVAGWVTVISTLLVWFVFERVPHIPDSTSYLFQAKYFSTGQLYLPAPPSAAAFEFDKFYNDGTRWWAYGFPGWPSILAIGVLAGVPWLVNPILGGLTVLIVHALLCRLYNRSTATIVIALMAVSPWFLFMSASFMPHTVSIVFGLLALLLVEKERGDRRGYWGTLAGVCMGLLFLTRPLEGILVGGVIGLWCLGLGGDSRLSARGIAGVVIAGALVAGLIFPYNYTLTDHPLHTPHKKWSDERWYPGADRLGFGPDVGNLGWPHIDPLPGHGPADILINTNRNFYMANFELFGWSFGSLGFTTLWLLLGQWRRTDWLFLSIIAVIIAGHSFYWFSGGPDIGARYWYQMLVPLIVLTTRGAQTLQRRLSEAKQIDFSFSVAGFIVLACLVAFINVMPWRSLGKYYRYRGQSADIERLAQTHHFDNNSLVFIQTEEQDEYAAALIFNPRTLDSPGTIYARDAGPVHREVVQRYFADRQVWFVARVPPDGGHLQVVDGPLPLRGSE